MWYEALGHGRGSHGCGATDYCIVGRGGPAPGMGQDFAITHRAGEPSGAGPHYFGVSRRAFGLCRGAGDAGEPADGDAVRGACCRTGSVGGAGRSRALAGMRGLRRRREPGLSGWRAQSQRNWGTPTSCGRPVCWPRMHAITDRAGHSSLANLAQGTVCKILAAHEVKPHKVRYYLERRDPEFEPKMAEVLCVYREVAMRRAEPGGGAQQPTVAVTRNPASRQSVPSLPTVAQCPVSIRRSVAITSTSGMGWSP